MDRRGVTVPEIQLRDVTFAYDPVSPVLRGLSFTLEPGNRVCLTGPNGGGKSTLLHVIMGLVRPSNGEVEVLGRTRRSEADFMDVRKQVGLLFQDSDSQLFSPTVFDDVAFGPLNIGMRQDEIRDVVRETLATLGLSAYADRITYKLSHGEKRLVALATILSMRPKVILLDEPTAGLDRRHEARLMEILLSRPEDMLIVSHNDPFMERVATRVVHLEDGQIQDAPSTSPH